MGVDPVRAAAQGLDLSSRVRETVVVAASPAAAAETIIATLSGTPAEAVTQGVSLTGWAAYTVGTNGTAVRFRIRQTDASGTVIADTGALTGGVAAAALRSDSLQGIDTAPSSSRQVYVLTMQVTAGSAPSTVSAVSLRAIVV